MAVKVPPMPAAGRDAAYNAAVTVCAIVLVDGAYYSTMPLLPDFLRALGVEPAARVAGWTGLLMGITPAIAAAAGPLWGKVGDRTGLRLMALRSTLVLSLVWLGMALARSEYHLLALRVLLGLLGGYQTMVMALATHGAGLGETGRIIARVQIAQIATAALAPALGGTLSGLVGIRSLFVASSASCLAAVFVFARHYRNVPAVTLPEAAEAPSGRTLAIRWLAFLLFLQAMIDRSFQPASALWAAAHSYNRAESAQIAGLILSVGALGDGIAAWMCGRVSASRARRTLLLRSAAGSAICILLGLVFSLPALLALRLALSLAAQGGLTIFYMLASRVVPEGRRSSDFSLLSSCALFGHGAGSFAAGWLASRDIAYVFYLNAALYAGMAALAQRLRALRRLTVEAA